MTPGWEDLMTVLRRRPGQERLTPAERESGLKLAMTLGTSSVPGTLGCSVTMADPGNVFFTPVTDGPLAYLLDQVQYESGHGPCLSAARHEQPVLVEALAGDRRWPELAARAEQAGVHTSMSLPLHLDGAPAALNFYGSAGASYGADHPQHVAHLVAKVATRLLRPAGPDVPGPDQIRNLATRRSQITRAVALVMARDGVSATQAYRTLAVRSGQEQQPLAQVVSQLLTDADPAARKDA